MSQKLPSIPPERWPSVEELFDRLMDAADPDEVLRQEPDRAVAVAAARLWRNDQAAAIGGFLEEPLTLIGQLTAHIKPVFEDGQVLAGRFVVDRLLGSGGMGEVYRALDNRLGETVAIKTIRRDLAADPAVRRRFVAEVQNARRVTHRHVCRINELFDEGNTPFFSMQYLEGVRLADWLGASRARPVSARRRIALELAEGLSAAHRAGILHCDFKPANVVLTGTEEEPASCITDFGLARTAYAHGVVAESAATANRSFAAGTRGYLAPELLEGGTPSVRSDIYSYGRVLSELMPENRLAKRCTAPLAEDRPVTMESVLRELNGFTRRAWLAGSAAAALAISGGAYALNSRPRIVLAGRQRLAINGFHPDSSNRSYVVRDLLVTALRQSPMLLVMSDDRIRAVLRLLNRQPKLPVQTGTLLAAAMREGALAIEGALEQRGSGLRLLLQIFPQGESERPLKISEQVDDERQVVHLADQAALRLRHELGESAGALTPGTGYIPLAQVTSANAEAVDLYYRGLDEYAKAHARAALTWFDEALRIDPDFVLAHMQRGIALASQDELASALPSYEKAFALRNRVSERERLWIEGRYYNIIEDYVSSLATCRRLTVLFPEEATFQRNVAFAATRVGRPQDALPFSERAIELDPANETGLVEWLANHCDANLPDEALEKFRRFREEGHTSTLLDYGAGIAHTCKSEYDEAVRDFERMGTAPERERWARLERCIPLIASGQWARAATELAADIAYDAAISEELRQMTRRYWLGMDAPWHAAQHAETLSGLEATPGWFPSLREGAMLALEIGRTDLAEKILNSLREVERQWPSTDTRGSRALLEGLLTAGRDPEAASEILIEARGLWPDPITLYGVGRFQSRAGDQAGALTTLEMLEEARGRAYRLFFPGLVALGRVERARVLAGLGRRGESAKLYRQVLADWGSGAAKFSIFTQVQSEYKRLVSQNEVRQGE